MNFSRMLAAGALASAAFLGAAQAAPLAADGSWAVFSVDGNLPPYSLAWIDDSALPLNFSFTIAAGFQGTLTVVDAGFSGDAFQVHDQGVLLGSTSAPVAGDPTGAIEFDFDSALGNARFSRGIYTLGAGTHDITGVLSQSLAFEGVPLNATLGAVRLQVSAVPEPATLATLLAGLSLLAGVLRRRGDRR